jgi:hypothetical protein
MASIDRMDWHYGGNYPENLPEENGGTHIGMFLTWIIDNNLIGQLHRDESSEEIQQVKNRQITGRDFLINCCDEKFWDDCLNEDGLKFTRYYYESDSTEVFSNYMDDYVGALGGQVESIYEIENSWENYNILKPVIDKKYREWKQTI